MIFSVSFPGILGIFSRVSRASPKDNKHYTVKNKQLRVNNRQCGERGEDRGKSGTYAMNVLGVETSTLVGSVAVASEEGLIGEYTLNVGLTHTERLLPAIDQLLQGLAIPFSDIDALAISLGPGSFTGLRIGISTIKGLSFASEKPVVGIPTLDALAHHIQGSESLICPMLDARKKEVFAALYRRNRADGLQKLTAYLATAPDKLLRDLDEEVVFLGDGSRVYRSLIEASLGSRAAFAPPHLNHPRAATVAFLGMEELKKGNATSLDTLTPIYVRPSEAELREQSLRRKQ
jgi:tRNA threonylcarbamoyladenosine biosynthesis protein TsaB